MAGSSISLEYRTIGDREVSRAFERLVRAGKNTQTLSADIGEYLLSSHEQRFIDQESPDGEPWEPLSEAYIKRKRKNRDKVLIRDADLKDTLSYNAQPESLEFGTNRIYGATHQFGDDSRNIPARPFIGISGDDETEILLLADDYLFSALEG